MCDRRKMTKNFLSGKDVLFFIIIIALIIMFLVPSIRVLLNKPFIIGETPYYDIRLAKEITQEGLVFQDELNNLDYMAKPYHLFLIPFLYFGTIDFLLIIPFIAGILSVIFLYFLLKKFEMSNDESFFVLLIFVLSPAFIFTFTTLNVFAISLLFIIAGSYLFLKQKRILYPTILFILASFLNIINVVFIILFLFFISDLKKEKRSNANMAIAYILFFSFIYYLLTKALPNFLFQNNFHSFVADLGSPIGLSVFALILGTVGIIKTWPFRKKLKNMYLLLLILVLIGFFDIHVNIYLTLLFSILAGFAFAHLVNKKWEVEALRRLTILLLIYGLLFSMISYTKRISTSDPDDSIIEALEWLKENSDSNDVVLSHHSKGYWIEYFADRPIVFDYMKQNPLEQHSLLYSRDLDATKYLLNKSNVKYIFIDGNMKQGQVWKEKQGLWFLLRNSETFNNIYQRKNVEIWEYKESPQIIISK
jgi:hypothetical protein